MKKPDFPDIALFACNGSKCGKHKDFRKTLKSEIKDNFKDVEIFRTECTDRCKHAPIVSLQPINIWYYECTESTVSSIIKEIKKVRN